ncbi:winged helix-turn-helix transcriptional regulator [Paraburkholderia sp.]|jgi:DNA-binding HxlR family transcriptional regulator|uniref:winged helix-turn-helix transcriptional regulator n=1 Tax=Paraburkholderia sp. TaxID=1926495 RepID=UPI002F3F25B9
MATRSYNDGCAGGHALDLVGERWALLVVRELLLGPKRFTDLRAGLPAISPNVLTQRLDELEQAAVLRRRQLPPPAAAWVYELTEWGYELEPVIMALGRWGARSPSLPRGNPLSIDSLILSFRTMFDAQAAAGLNLRLELRLGAYRFDAKVANGEFEIARGNAAEPNAVIESDPDTLAALAYDGRKLDEAVRSRDLTIEGDKASVKRFLTLFKLPEPAPGVEN